MHTTLDCLECLVRQSLRVARMVTDERDAHDTIMHRVMVHLADADLSSSPTEISSTIYRIIHDVTGITDPYAGVKCRFNDLALEMLPDLESRVDAASDPWDAAVRIALAGNIIDFGGGLKVDAAVVRETVEASLVDPISGLGTAEARRHVERAASILYVGDNAGEIVFDRLLLQRIGPGKVTFAVRGAPIINDATLEDARAAGLTDLVRVIDTGWDGPGAPPHRCGEAFVEALETASLVIAKGQGNYETMSGIERPVLFLLRAKCPVVAEDIGVPLGSMVIGGRNLDVDRAGISS
jgi:uncharacterized protein with ATP-grasp and redox domains